MGTYADIFYLAGLLWGVTAFVLLLVAWRAAVGRNIGLHRMLMALLTIGAWLFILGYVMRFAYPDEFSLDVPPHLVPWLAVHGTVALFPLFGATILVWARFFGSADSHFNRCHKYYGRAVVALWLFTRAGGILNFWLFR